MPIGRATARVTPSNCAAAARVPSVTATMRTHRSQRVDVWREEGIADLRAPFPRRRVRNRLRLAGRLHRRGGSCLAVAASTRSACMPRARPVRRPPRRPSSWCGRRRAHRRRHPRAGHQHLQRIQPVGRPLPLQRRRQGVVRPAAGARLSAPSGSARRRRLRRPRRQPARRARRGALAACRTTSPTASTRCGARRRAGTTGNVASCAGRSPRASRSTTPSNSDLEFHPEVLDGHRLMLSVGHDEYWSWGMRASCRRVRRRWRLLGRSSRATPCFWQVRYEDDGRTMVCYKGRATSEDPVAGTDDARTLSSIWSLPAIGRPEAQSIGLSFTRGGYARVGQATPRSSGGYNVHRPDHPAVRGHRPALRRCARCIAADRRLRGRRVRAHVGQR